MNILVINLDKAIFDENSSSRKRLEEYSQNLDKLFVIVWTKEKKEPIFFKNKLFIYPTNSISRIFYYFDSFIISKKIIQENKIDLIFTQDPFETGFCGWLLARKYKIPLQIQIHTDIFSLFFWRESLLNKIRVGLAKFLIPRANCIRAVSERIKKSLLSTFHILPSKIIVLPIFVDVARIKQIPVTVDLHKKYPQFDFIILMASRLTKEKNIGLAIEAMAEVVKRHPKAGLIIVGEGPERKALKSQITNHKSQSNVIFESFVPFEQLVSYYKTADLFLLTSNYEGYGMAVVEAMVAGCPVIMTNVGLAGEILIDKKNGLVVPTGNVKKLAEAILKFIENQELQNNLRKAAAEICNSWISKEEYLRDYYNSWVDCLRNF